MNFYLYKLIINNEGLIASLYLEIKSRDITELIIRCIDFTKFDLLI